MKKWFLTTLVFTGLLGCCLEGYIPYWQIDAFTVDVADGNWQDPVDNQVMTDSLYLGLRMEIQYVSSYFNFSDLFVQQALAWSCPSDGDDGPKDQISSISFTCNRDFDGIPKGHSLNSRITDYSGLLSLDDWILFMNGPLLSIGHEFLINQKPPDEGPYIFTVAVKFETGRTLSAATDEIRWF